ncbi:Putative adhesin [Colwellia chukchiensis]|uniref:Putative adhesin n=2 Tax=Colwellia chukchiensis TaxID=641665 RepID=A0A1H7RD93_9GAMM|nr:Putative adhesin [Colwellia chukchiensis]
MANLSKLLPIILLSVATPSIAGEQVNQTLPLTGANIVSIENLRGEVTLIGNNADEVIVTGELDDKAEGLTFEKVGSRIMIKVELPRGSHNDWGDSGSDLTVTIPKHVKVRFKGVSSDVKISNFTQGSEVQTVSGDIEASDLTLHSELVTVSGNVVSKNLAGKVRISSVSGDIDDKNSSGRLHLKTVSGSINADSSAQEVSAHSVSGDIELALAAVDELIASTVSGEFEGELSLNEHGLIKMSSVSGDLALTFNNAVQASFQLKANAGGNIINQLTSAKATRAKYGPSSKLSFDTGNASAAVQASTVSGRIKIK